jgi:hypothetical protein
MKNKPHADLERCAGRGCNQALAGRSVITSRDGKRYCKHHEDRLPPYRRRAQIEINNKKEK